MVRARAGERKERLDRIQPAHAALGLGLAAFDKALDVIVRVVLAAEKIAIQRQDDLRLVELVNRTDGLVESLGGSALMDARINRVVGEPLRPGKFPRDELLQPRARRRRAALGEERQPFALVRGKLL